MKAVERLKTEAAAAAAAADEDGADIWASATEAMIEMSSAEDGKWRPTRENYELQAEYSLV